MSLLLGRRLPLGFLKKPSVSTTEGTAMGANARADILVKLAGNIRNLYEFVSGERVDSDNKPVAPLAPHSKHLPGHDHSGGVFGQPIQRVMWAVIYGNGRNLVNAQIENGYSPEVNLTTADVSQTIIDSEARAVFIPNGGTDTSHNTAQFHFRVNTDVAVKWTFRIVNYEFEYTHVVDDAATGQRTVVVPDAGRIKLFPGVLQRFRLDVSAERKAADAFCTVMSAALLMEKTSP